VRVVVGVLAAPRLVDASTLNTENSPTVTPYTGKKLSTVMGGARRMLL
jgi:hypothetical protein